MHSAAAGFVKFEHVKSTIIDMIKEVRKEYEKFQILTQYFHHHSIEEEGKNTLLQSVITKFKHEFQKIQQELLDDKTINPAIPTERLETFISELASENIVLIKKYESSFLNIFINKIYNLTNKRTEEKKEDVSEERSYDLYHTYVGEVKNNTESTKKLSDIAFQSLPKLEEQKAYKKLVELYENLEYDDLKSKHPHGIETRYESCVNKLGCVIRETTSMPSLDVINHYLSQSKNYLLYSLNVVNVCFYS